jgi:hypothetical protein
MCSRCEDVRRGDKKATLASHGGHAQRRFRPDAASAARIR